LKSATPSIGEIASVTRGNHINVDYPVLSDGKMFESKTWSTYRKVKEPHSLTLADKKKFTASEIATLRYTVVHPCQSEV
jgi:hypothetical protein